MTLRYRFRYLDRLGPEGPIHWLGNVKDGPGLVRSHICHHPPSHTPIYCGQNTNIIIIQVIDSTYPSEEGSPGGEVPRYDV